MGLLLHPAWHPCSAPASLPAPAAGHALGQHSFWWIMSGVVFCLERHPSHKKKTKQLETSQVANHYQPSDQWSFQCAAYSAVAVRSSLQHNWTAPRRSRWPGDSEQWMPKFLQPETLAVWKFFSASNFKKKENDLRHPTASSWISTAYGTWLQDVFLMFGQPLIPHTWNSSVDLGRLHKAVPETCCAAAQLLWKIQVLEAPSRFSFQHSLGGFSMAQHGSAAHFMPTIAHLSENPKKPSAHLCQISKVQQLLSSRGHRLAVFPGVKDKVGERMLDLDNSMYSCHWDKPID